MLTKIKNKIRGLVKDFEKRGTESFTYTVTNEFKLAESNVGEIEEVILNGVTLESAQYTFESPNKISLDIESPGLVQEDAIDIIYSYYKYSDEELEGAISSALVWLSVFGYDEEDYELVENEELIIDPTPNNKTTDLISLISAIILKPEYSEYRLADVTVRYIPTIPTDKRIELLITRFKWGVGINDLLEWNQGD